MIVMYTGREVHYIGDCIVSEAIFNSYEMCLGFQQQSSSEFPWNMIDVVTNSVTSQLL